MSCPGARPGDGLKMNRHKTLLSSFLFCIQEADKLRVCSSALMYG